MMPFRQQSRHAKTVLFPHNDMAYAATDIKKGDIVEEAPVILILDKGRNAHMFASRGFTMYFPWDEKGERICAAMGTASRYGYSLEPNTTSVVDQSTRVLTITATRDIQKGEHLTRIQEFYGYEDQSPALDPIEVPDNLEVNPIEVGDSPYGKGVFATRDIKEGELVEPTFCLYVRPQDRMALGRTGFMNYVFAPQTDDKEGTRFYAARIALGYGGIYNHSFEPNVWRDKLDKDRPDHGFLFLASRDIKKGEEMFHDYGWKQADNRFA